MSNQNCMFDSTNTKMTYPDFIKGVEAVFFRNKTQFVEK